MKNHLVKMVLLILLVGLFGALPASADVVQVAEEIAPIATHPWDADDADPSSDSLTGGSTDTNPWEFDAIDPWDVDSTDPWDNFESIDPSIIEDLVYLALMLSL